MTGDNYDLLIVDGSSFAHRAGGALFLTGESGENTSVIFGVLNMIRSFLLKHTFTEVCIVWDGKNYKEAKQRVYPDYKANRPKPSDDDNPGIRIEIRRQIEILKKILPALGIKQLGRDELEADDVIGLLCEGLEGKKILIVSNDKDLLQLISKNISMYYPPDKSFLTPDNFEQEVGVSLSNFIFYKTIVGDMGDNVRGLKGFGDVTAKKLLKAHGPWTEWYEAGLAHSTILKEEVLQSLKGNQKKVLLEPVSLFTLIQNYTLMCTGWLDVESKDDLVGDYNNQVPMFDEEVVKSGFLEKKFEGTLKRFNGWVLPFLELVHRGHSDEAFKK